MVQSKQRIAKWLSQLGYGSRRQVEADIIAGHVVLNKEVIQHPVYFVDSQDVIYYKGYLVKQLTKPPRLWLFYKPNLYLCSRYNDEGKPTIFDILPTNLPYVMSVGRLDYNSEGLLLLTNKGPLARYLEHPEHHMRRVYEIRVFGDLPQEGFGALKKGFNLEGFEYKPVLVEPIDIGKRHHWLRVVLLEGKNREIRKLMNHYGLQVSRLIRVSYAGFELGNMKPNELKELDFQFIEPYWNKVHDQS